MYLNLNVSNRNLPEDTLSNNSELSRDFEAMLMMLIDILAIDPEGRKWLGIEDLAKCM